jgi:hypothetical protein
MANRKPVRRRTNIECLTGIMEFSDYGALAQVFVMDALAKHAAHLTALSDEEADRLDTPLFSGRAWRAVAREIGRKLDAHLRG